MNIPYAAIKPFEPYGIPKLTSADDGGIPDMLQNLAMSLKLMKTTIIPNHFLNDVARMMVDRGARKAVCKTRSQTSEEGVYEGTVIVAFWTMTGRDRQKAYLPFTFPLSRQWGET